MSNSVVVHCILHFVKRRDHILQFLPHLFLLLEEKTIKINNDAEIGSQHLTKRQLVHHHDGICVSEGNPISVQPGCFAKACFLPVSGFTEAKNDGKKHVYLFLGLLNRKFSITENNQWQKYGPSLTWVGALPRTDTKWTFYSTKMNDCDRN